MEKLLSDLKIVNIEILLCSATANTWAIGISKVCFRLFEKMVSLLWILEIIGWEHFDFCVGSSIGGKLMRDPL